MSESSCCGSRVYLTDICTKCGEHCDVIEAYCPHCQWDGPNSEVIGDDVCPKCGKRGIEDV